MPHGETTGWNAGLVRSARDVQVDNRARPRSECLDRSINGRPSVRSIEQTVEQLSSVLRTPFGACNGFQVPTTTQ